jgi:Flp pilus assembly protein TadD
VARDGLGVAPFDPELRLALGAALSDGVHDAEAETQLQLAFTLNPNWPEGYMRLAWALAGRKRFEEGINALAQATRLAPNDAYTQYILANFLASVNRIPEAQATASHARELAMAAGQHGLVQQIEQLQQKLNVHP